MSEDSKSGENEGITEVSAENEILEPITGETMPHIKPGLSFRVQRDQHSFKTNLSPHFEGNPTECIQGPKSCLGPFYEESLV